MKARAKYDFTLDTYKGHPIIYITDEGGPTDLSVTNDIENVITEIEDKEHINLSSYIILYRDGYGNWDAWRNNDFLIFGETNSLEAADLYLDYTENN